MEWAKHEICGNFFDAFDGGKEKFDSMKGKTIP